jgi:hypothetical protein
MATRNETYDGSGNLISLVDDRDINDVKVNKWNQINVFREVVLNRGLWYLGYLWNTDERSRQNITGVTAGIAAGIGLPPGFTWRDMNNNNVPFTTTNTVTLAGLTMAYVNMVYNASWEMKNEVDALTTVEEIDAYSIPDNANWPNGDMDGSRPA